MTDAGNFQVPVWRVEEGLTHELPVDTLFRTTYKAIMPPGYFIRVVAAS